MRRHAVLLTGVAVLFAGAGAWAGQETADETKVLDQVLAAYGAAFNAHDAKALAALYAEDADVVLPTGVRVKGREDVEQGLADYFAANPQVEVRNTVISRRFIKPDVVMEDGEWQESGHTQKGQATKGLYTVVLVKQRGKWLIICERAMVPLGEAGASKDSGRKPIQDTKADPGKGAARKVLEQLAGRWDFTGTVYGGDGKSEVLRLAGTFDAGFLADSSWLAGKGQGRANDKPFEFVSILCYDEKKGRYTATGAHSVFPTTLYIDEAVYDEASKTFAWKEGEMVEPETGQTVTSKGEDIIKDTDTSVTVGYIKRPGSNEFVKWYEITNKRRRGP